MSTKINKYDIGARIAAITAEQELKLQRHTSLMEVVSGMFDADHPAVIASKKSVKEQADRLAAIKDGTLFAQQPWLISISGT